MTDLFLVHRRSRTGVPDRDRGYSLMEVLVMLAITAVVSALILQTIRAATANGLRIERHSQATIHDRLDVIALRRAMSGALIGYANTDDAFRGTATYATGLTARPMAPGDGPVVPFRLEIETDTASARLVYEEDGQRYRILETDGGDLALSYWWDDGETGRWIEQWPPADGFVGPAYPSPPFYTPLPQLVRVSTHSTDTNFALVLGLPQDMPPQPRSSDLFGMTP